MKTTVKQKRGFACMDPELRKEIASKGGKTISENKEYMREIGSRGGKASGVNRRNAAEKSKTTKGS